ncbi:ABC transporter ATP-binding protein [Virgisporangium ochraceum]|uniref:ABC transporter ATP-binding protein n=1 Tax=Virgisporangium ochraceum TaxID=65505 RepID=A0A8J4EHJ4_9ACTN|nr:ABC transporter ATP-binding protein [Virgisporangium ochraceum]GIJ74788.1 ABC transporter ATP-binding protein [Virgisporangium ochraceum]
MLHVESLHAGYDNLRVLHGIDLDVPAGDLLAVIGANGAGKTTVLRAVSGLIRPSSGRVTVDGRAVTGLRAEKVAAAGLAHVPENRLVFPSLTVADNLALGGWTRRSSRLTDDRDRVLDLFPRLRSRLAQPAGTLSGGEQQMVVIGRGLMAGPKVLVLDEPSVGLAPRLVAEIFAALARLRDEAGLAILLVEQNARAAFRVADRVAVMDRGRIATKGTPAELAGDDRVQRAYLGGGYSESSTVD